MLMVTALSGKSLTAWGSDFGPYTSDGDWWRLLTALFLHAGLLHVVLNMWGLASFGPAAERLFGSVNYLLLYLVSGVAGNLASIAWHPDVNGVGASGAIMGVLGSLLAAQWRIENKVLRSVLRPLRNSVLLFAAYALVTGFIHANIDNAAHLGGFAAGILTGLAVARPITGERVYGRRDVLALLRLVPVAMLILSAGFWYARHKAATLSGDGLYWSTVHWLRGGEHATVQKFNSALALESNNRDLTALANAVDNDVLPFWREASNRLSSIHLTADSQNISGLELLQLLSDGRIKAFEHLSKAARANDGLQVSAAELELKQVETGAFARHKAEQ